MNLNYLNWSESFQSVLIAIRNTGNEKAAKVARHILEEAGRDPKPHNIHAGSGGDVAKYNFFCCSISDPFKISFWKADKLENLIEREIIEPCRAVRYCKDTRKKHALHAKPSKAVRHIFGDDFFTDSELEQFTNAWASEMNPDALTFEVLTNGEQIADAYNSNSYEDNSGNSLWGSCMRYAERAERCAIYESFGARLLVLRDDQNKVRGRALLWDNVITGAGEQVRYLDRIYTRDMYFHLFANYAKENDYTHAYEADFDKLGLKKLKEGAIIDAPDLMDTDELIPYFDTFNYYMPTRDECTNSDDLAFQQSEYYKFDAYEHGLIDGLNAVHSDYCGEFILRSDAVYISTNNRDTYIHVGDTRLCAHSGDYYISLDTTEIDGTYYGTEHTQYDNYLEKYLAPETEVVEAIGSGRSGSHSVTTYITAKSNAVKIGRDYFINNEDTNKALQVRARMLEREARQYRRALTKLSTLIDKRMRK